MSTRPRCTSGLSVTYRCCRRARQWCSRGSSEAQCEVAHWSESETDSSPASCRCRWLCAAADHSASTPRTSGCQLHRHNMITVHVHAVF